MAQSRNGTSVLTQAVESTVKLDFDTVFDKLVKAALANGRKAPKKGEFLERIIKESPYMKEGYDLQKYFSK